MKKRKMGSLKNLNINLRVIVDLLIPILPFIIGIILIIFPFILPYKTLIRSWFNIYFMDVLLVSSFMISFGFMNLTKMELWKKIIFTALLTLPIMIIIGLTIISFTGV